MDEARLTEQGKLVALLRKLATQGGWHHREERDTWGSAADEIEKLAAIIVCERIDAQALREQLGEAQADLEIIRRSQPAAMPDPPIDDTARPKPTIRELEEILNDAGTDSIEILPNGEIRAKRSGTAPAVTTDHPIDDVAEPDPKPGDEFPKELGNDE